MRIGKNKAWFGSNKVELTKDTVYTHPSSKQCSYSYTHPTTRVCSRESDPITDIKTYTTPSARSKVTLDIGVGCYLFSCKVASPSNETQYIRFKSMYDSGDGGLSYSASSDTGPKYFTFLASVYRRYNGSLLICFPNEEQTIEYKGTVDMFQTVVNNRVVMYASSDSTIRVMRLM